MNTKIDIEDRHKSGRKEVWHRVSIEKIVDAEEVVDVGIKISISSNTKMSSDSIVLDICDVYSLIQCYKKHRASRQKRYQRSMVEKETYLIQDLANGYFKIGKSLSSLNRERTLLSEKPILSLRYVCKRDVEKELHAKYAEKNIRGEWFNLTEEDITEICKNYNFQNVNSNGDKP